MDVTEQAQSESDSDPENGNATPLRSASDSVPESLPELERDSYACDSLAEDPGIMESSGEQAPQPEQAFPLAEAAFRAGVSVQALRQRIKRGTLTGADAFDTRGQKVAGVLPADLRRAFPDRDFGLGGASQSNSPVPATRPSGGASWDDAWRVHRAAPQANWDPEADLERGGMAPAGDPGRVPQIDPSGFPSARGRSSGGLGVGLWGIGLIVALAAVGVAGLMTGAREARAASKRLNTAYEHELLLLDQLKDARNERDRALSRVEELNRQLEALSQR